MLGSTAPEARQRTSSPSDAPGPSAAIRARPVEPRIARGSRRTTGTVRARPGRAAGRPPHPAWAIRATAMPRRWRKARRRCLRHARIDDQRCFGGPFPRTSPRPPRHSSARRRRGPRASARATADRDHTLGHQRLQHRGAGRNLRPPASTRRASGQRPQTVAQAAGDSWLCSSRSSFGNVRFTCRSARCGPAAGSSAAPGR
jgi:hypothetical protein